MNVIYPAASRGRWRASSALLGVLGVLGSVLVACGGGVAVKPLRSEPTVVLDPAARDAKIKDDLGALQGQVTAYFHRYGSLPDRLPDLQETPDGEPLINELPMDPWSVPYLIQRFDQDVVIYTTGPDLIVGSSDDIKLRMSFEGVESKAAIDAPSGS